MSIKILIDHREHSSFKDKILTIFDQNVISLQQLDLGDIQFVSNDKTYLIIERKTINDLATSLNDGRYHEQKNRLIQANKETRVIYLLENDFDQFDSTYNKHFNYQKYRGVIINTMVRDGISVYCTKDLDESIEFLKDIYQRISTYNGKRNYLESVKVKKKDNMTPQLCYQQQLRQIPGVSANISQIVTENYSNMSTLIQAYQQLETEKEKEKMLEKLQIGNRKLGPAVSKRIYQYLFDCKY